MNALPHHLPLSMPMVTFSSITHAGRLADMWRHSLSGIREDIRFIAQYRKVIAERDELVSGKWQKHSAAYVAACETNLATVLKRYSARVRVITETEQKMDDLGIPFAVSSDAWSEAA